MAVAVDYVVKMTGMYKLLLDFVWNRKKFCAWMEANNVKQGEASSLLEQDLPVLSPGDAVEVFGLAGDDPDFQHCGHHGVLEFVDDMDVGLVDFGTYTIKIPLKNLKARVL